METADVITRLAIYGYSATEADTAVITMCISKVTSYIKTFCNITSVPTELDDVALDMVCGEFLNVKYLTGQLELTNLDLTSGAVQSISEGDTSVTLNAASSDTGKLTAFISNLMNKDRYLICFRRLKW